MFFKDCFHPRRNHESSSDLGVGGARTGESFRLPLHAGGEASPVSGSDDLAKDLAADPQVRLPIDAEVAFRAEVISRFRQ
jgi:hypothetical protein